VIEFAKDEIHNDSIDSLAFACESHIDSWGIHQGIKREVRVKEEGVNQCAAADLTLFVTVLKDRQDLCVCDWAVWIDCMFRSETAPTLGGHPGF
jgi:hypothetical protein